jgi:lipoprotein LpqB-like beta-propeller protein/sporulation and spore germination protein
VVSRETLRRALAALTVLLSAVLAAGCVSMPTGGPVQSYPVTQGTGAPNQPNAQFQPQPPGDNWNPQQIVQGFLAASASFGDYSQMALAYLTPLERKVWTNPTDSAVIYKSGPYAATPVYPKAGQTAKTATTATVPVTGNIQATLDGSSYSVPSSQATAASDAPPPFQLVKDHGGQWRISVPPLKMLLTSGSFANDYQLRNLYFFDPTGSYLVPDPIYVPLRAPGDLMNVLVKDLISQPKDWLYGAAKTVLPPGTKIGSITVDGALAVVNLTGSIAKDGGNVPLLEQVSAQLVWTLSASGQSGSTGAVTSVEVKLNGVAWSPPGSHGNPVQQKQQSQKFAPPTGASSVYYYLDSAGYLRSRQGAGKSVRHALIGNQFTQVAVSPDGTYLAALRGNTLYTGLVGGALEKRGDGYQSMSWDANDDLWTALEQQILVYRAAPSLRQPGQLTPVPVNVINNNGIEHLTVPYTGLRVAPDGVRVAIIIASDELTFGAISGQDGPAPQIHLSLVQLNPLNAAAFTGLTWYGPDNVITLASGPAAATEYSVSGGNPTSIPVEPGMRTITGSLGNLLIASLDDGSIVSDNSLSGAWTMLGTGVAPTYPG